MDSGLHRCKAIPKITKTHTSARGALDTDIIKHDHRAFRGGESFRNDHNLQ